MALAILYHIFTLSPLCELDTIAKGKHERDHLIREHKKGYPKVKVYWQVVRGG